MLQMSTYANQWQQRLGSANCYSSSSINHNSISRVTFCAFHIH